MGRALSARVLSFSGPTRGDLRSPSCSSSRRLALHAQGPAPRPWLDWHTVETPHFALHYPSAYREWTLALAQRIETVRGQVVALVGYGPTRRVHIVIDDPINDANGYAFTALDAPTIVLWPVSPDPRSEIGDYARLAGPPRDARVRARRASHASVAQSLPDGCCRSVSPVPLGPIATKAPRWVTEGYATYVEGRVTGTGRPNHAWRAAILRQFALEGRLPAYGQLSSTGGWKTGEFAYLAGSAYLEWLARREGDSSVVALWRRMTAKTDRSFSARSPECTADLPPSCMVASPSSSPRTPSRSRASFGAQQLTEGTLVQRLRRTTGDPAISPDGRFVALTIRKRRCAERRRGLEDGRRAGHRRRRAPRGAASSRSGGRAGPQLLSAGQEGRRLARRRRRLRRTRRRDGSPTTSGCSLTRNVPARDGTYRPDLFVWSAEDGSLARITRARRVARRRSFRGRRLGRRRSLRARMVRSRARRSRDEGGPRPARGKRDAQLLSAARVAPHRRHRRLRAVRRPLAHRARLLDDGRAPLRRPRRRRESLRRDLRRRRRVDRDDVGARWLHQPRATRPPTVASPLAITRVTGAAVAADVAPDGAIWFLNLQSSGYDLRRIRPDSARIDTPLPTIALGETRSPA